MPIIELELSMGQPCIVETQTNNNPESREDYLLQMEGWNQGCVDQIDGTYYANDWDRIESFPNISEYNVW